jgi:hypothetical protein
VLKITMAKFTSLKRYCSFLVSIPRFARILIPAQTLFNLLLVLWIYEEYLHNRYFQVYVNDSLRGSFLGEIFLVSTGSLIIVAVFLYGKLQSYRREFERIVSTGTFRAEEDGVLDRSIRWVKILLSRLFRRLRRLG